MRVAFVGKGGSGKTSTAAIFSLVISQKEEKMFLVDADINKHFGQLLGVSPSALSNKDLSLPDNMRNIKSYLKGSNDSIVAMGAFRKSTPPQKTSGFVIPHLANDFVTSNYCIDWNGHYFAQVGTYEETQVGTSCYHASLSVLENILSHMIDSHTFVVADMVAGTDAFSNTLHTQFDLLVIVVEPTIRSLEVYKKYVELSKAGGVLDQIIVVGNKVSSPEDILFIEENIPKEQIIGYQHILPALSVFDKSGEPLNIRNIDRDTVSLMEKIYDETKKRRVKPSHRFKKIVDIHKEYIKKDFVTERYGDVSNQIDESFNIDDIFQIYEQQK